MSQHDFGIPFVDSVFHPSDFSLASESAFAHALAIALIRKTEFTILHVDKDPEEGDWTKFPPVRAALERWGYLDEQSPRSAVFKDLQVRIKKVSAVGKDPAKACLGYLEKHPTDLIVLATETGESALPKWLKRSVAETLARKSETKTLFVPGGGRGFVSFADGTISLKKILLPVDSHPNPRAAVTYASRIAEIVGGAEIYVLHVGEEGALPELFLPESETANWTRVSRTGSATEGILATADDHDVDLVIMATEGRQGIFDALRGTVTDQVVRELKRPLLAVPAN